MTGEDTISFDKDDDDTLDFVTAAANLRSAAYGILGKSRWEVKEMAGNIIPAIATTNAIISGLIVLQALHLLRAAFDSLRNVHAQFKPSAPLSSIKLSLPNPHCGVCRDAYALLQCDPSRVTLAEVLKGILDGSDREVSTYEDKRMLSDPDFDDNLDRTLESLNVTKGKFLNIADEYGELETISLAICTLPPNHPVDGPAMILPSPLPNPAKRAKPVISQASSPPPSTPLRVQKRPAPDNVDEAQPAKRARVDTSPSKLSRSTTRRLEEDGLILLDGNRTMDEDLDIVVID
jgi:ubiquitin-like 1-activating enzyme E1 B